MSEPKEESILSITAEPSNGEGATSGKIIIMSKETRKDIPAVVFSPEKADNLLEIVDKIYALE